MRILEINNKKYSREEVKRYFGDIQQIAGIKHKGKAKEWMR
ncbi:MAG: hypothetical protein ACOCQN_00270 [Halanaerobiaceae bacterium]